MQTSKTTNTPRTSGADIVVPESTSKALSFDTGEGDHAMFRRLRWLKERAAQGGNTNDVAIVLIEACIEEGVCTRPRIVAVLKAIGLNARHVGLMLDRGTGRSPVSHRWRVDGDGRYSLLVAEGARATPP